MGLNGVLSSVDAVFIINNTLRYVVVLAISYFLFEMERIDGELLDKLFIFSGAALILLSIYIYMYDYDFKSRFSGPFDNPNDYSLLLCCVIYSALHKIRTNFTKPYLNGFLLLLIISAMVTILLTMSRSGIAVAALLVTSYMVMVFFELSKFKKLLFSVSFLLASVAVINSTSFENFIEDTKLWDRITSDEANSSSEKRVLQINAGLNLLDQNPYIALFGVGISGTGDTEWFRHYYPKGYTDAVHVIHLTYMAVFVHHGIFGLLFFLTAFLIVLNKIYYSKSKNKIILYGQLGCLFIFSIFAYTVYYLPFWLYLVLLYIHSTRKPKLIANALTAQ